MSRPLGSRLPRTRLEFFVPVPEALLVTELAIEQGLSRSEFLRGVVLDYLRSTGRSTPATTTPSDTLAPFKGVSLATPDARREAADGEEDF